jgi:hypothetical protein
MTATDVLPDLQSHKARLHGSQQQVMKSQELQGVSEKVPSAINEPPPPSQNADTRPNGGFLAWIQVVCSFCLYFNTYGKLIIDFISQIIY